MTEPEHVPVAKSTRGDLTESVHYGAWAVVGVDGALQHSAGRTDTLVYARSSLKPLQLVGMLRAGLDLPDDLLALAAASHSGARMHQDGVIRILDTHALSAGALKNAVDLPYGVREREDWLRAGGERTHPAQNCSGKHAAMLATCVVNGWSVRDYLEPAHPLQVVIRETIEQLTGETASPGTVDGCGTPLWAFTLEGLARSYAALASAAPGSAEHRVVTAMRAFPEMASGEGRDVARMMRTVPGLFAKDGAEGFQMFGIVGQFGAAVKISDGSDRARLPVTAAVLRELGVDAALSSDPVLGGGRAVGALLPY